MIERLNYQKNVFIQLTIWIKNWLIRVRVCKDTGTDLWSESILLDLVSGFVFFLMCQVNVVTFLANPSHNL
jgi:hypothetical protein